VQPSNNADFEYVSIFATANAAVLAIIRLSRLASQDRQSEPPARTKSLYCRPIPARNLIRERDTICPTLTRAYLRYRKKRVRWREGTEYQWLRSKRMRGEFNHVEFGTRESAGEQAKSMNTSPSWESHCRGGGGSSCKKVDFSSRATAYLSSNCHRSPLLNSMA